MSEQEYFIALPNYGNFLLTVANDYAVGCAYFISSGASGDSKNRIYTIAKQDAYFVLTDNGDKKLKIQSGSASGPMYLYQICNLAWS